MLRSKLGIFVFALFSAVLFFGCAQRYHNIPRVNHFGKSHTNKFQTGHFVTNQKVSLSPIATPSIDTFSYHENLLKVSHDLQRSAQLTSVPKIKKTISPHQQIFDTPVAASNVDTTYGKDIDKSLIQGSGAMFTIAAGMNAALLVTPIYNFFFVGLLLGLGLLIAGYFISEFVKNAKETRTRPVRLKSTNFTSRGKMKKAFNTLMIISGSSFSIALFTAATGSFELPFFFFFVGMLTLWAGLLVGLIYLIMGV